ncbi:MAG: hypothetical protein ABSF90_18610 [Syntrophobacteraceae bacterium]|jgi:hypothetical protein
MNQEAGRPSGVRINSEREAQSAADLPMSVCWLGFRKRGDAYQISAFFVDEAQARQDRGTNGTEFIAPAKIMVKENELERVKMSAKIKRRFCN